MSGSARTHRAKLKPKLSRTRASDWSSEDQIWLEKQPELDPWAGYDEWYECQPNDTDYAASDYYAHSRNDTQQNPTDE